MTFHRDIQWSMFCLSQISWKNKNWSIFGCSVWVWSIFLKTPWPPCMIYILDNSLKIHFLFFMNLILTETSTGSQSATQKYEQSVAGKEQQWSYKDLLVLRLIHWWRTHCRRDDALHVLLLTFWKLTRFSYIPRMSLSSIRRFRALSGIFLFTKRAQYCWEGGVMLRLPRSRAACPAGRYTIGFNRSMMKSISLTLVQSGEPIVISQPRFIMIFFSVPQC